MQSPNEMMEIIYDTLMKNTDNPVFDTELVNDQYLNRDSEDYQPRIFFTYNGNEFSLLLQPINRTPNNQ